MEQRLLILDDDPDDLNPLRDYLTIFGEVPFLATSDIDAAIAAASEDPGHRLRGVVFVCDYHLGRMTGYDVMKKVLGINPIVMFVFISNLPNVPILLDIINLGSGFYFLDKTGEDFYERVMIKIGKARASLDTKMKRIIDMENRRKQEEERQLFILEAASNTLKILNKHGEGSDRDII